MARTITIDGTDRTSIVRLDSFNLGTAAFRGQVGTGGFDLDDPAAAITIDPLKAVTVVEDQSSPTRILTGYTAERGIARGPLTAGTQRQWDITVEDLNVIFDDRIIRRTGKRPAETDRARVIWLLSEGALGSVTAGQVPNTNTENMHREDYRGRHARDVMEDCSQRAGKNFFIYDTGSGFELYYDKSANATTSPISISSDPADIDDLTVFGPSELEVVKDPERLYHRIQLIYRGGNVTRGSNPGGRIREKRVVNKRIRTRRAAIVHVKNMLERTASETVLISATLTVPNTVIGDIRAGQKIPIKLPHVGIVAFTNYRIAEVQIGPAGVSQPTDVLYRVRLTLADEIRPTHVQDVGGPSVPDDEKAPTASSGGEVETIDDACQEIDEFDRTVGPFVGNTFVYPTDTNFGTYLAGPWWDPKTWIVNGNGGSSGETFGIDGDEIWVNANEAPGHFNVIANNASESTIQAPVDKLEEAQVPYTIVGRFCNDRTVGTVGSPGESLETQRFIQFDTGVDQVYIRFTDNPLGPYIRLYAQNVGAVNFALSAFVGGANYGFRFTKTNDFYGFRVWRESVGEGFTTPDKNDAAEWQCYQAGPAFWNGAGPTQMLLELSADVTPGNGWSPFRVAVSSLCIISLDEWAAIGSVTLEPFTGDGTTVTFTTTRAFRAGTQRVYVDGLLTTTAYDADAGTVTFDVAPDIGAVVLVEFEVA